jgi:hypothetical protein
VCQEIFYAGNGASRAKLCVHESVHRNRATIFAGLIAMRDVRRHKTRQTELDHDALSIFPVGRGYLFDAITAASHMMGSGHCLIAILFS